MVVPLVANALQADPLSTISTLGTGTAPPSTSPTPSPTAAPGTLLLTCADANWGQLPANWRDGSLRVGPLWFVGGRSQGYVKKNGTGSGGAEHQQGGRTSGGVMIVEVASGSTVVMKVAPESQSHFQFLDGFGPNVGYQLPRGDTGFTFAACPAGDSGPNGDVTDFYLGFAGQAGRQALVDVWPSPSSTHPVQLLFPDAGFTGDTTKTNGR